MTRDSRRRTLGRLALLCAMPLLAPSLLRHLLAGAEDEDDRIAEQIFRAAREGSLGNAPMGAIVAAVAKQFLGSPYAAGTLEETGPERLVVNLRSFDCVTLVESTLALSRCIAVEMETPDAFRSELIRIRYRDGVVNGYPSRLHYFSDWMYENERKGVVNDITSALGGIPAVKTINFMTSRAERYPRLREESTRAALLAQERVMSTRRRFILPRKGLASAERELRDGDILGLTTSLAGLDVTHTGVAVSVDGRLHFLHAPAAGSAVTVSTRPLVQFLGKRETCTGVIVARAVRPGTNAEQK